MELPQLALLFMKKEIIILAVFLILTENLSFSQAVPSSIQEPIKGGRCLLIHKTQGFHNDSQAFLTEIKSYYGTDLAKTFATKNGQTLNLYPKNILYIVPYPSSENSDNTSGIIVYIDTAIKRFPQFSKQINLVKDLWKQHAEKEVLLKRKAEVNAITQKEIEEGKNQAELLKQKANDEVNRQAEVARQKKLEESSAPTTSQTSPDYYIIKRVSINIDSGIIGIKPGTKISIKERMSNGTCKIAFEEYEAVVEESNISNDPDIVKTASIEYNNALIEKAQKIEKQKADIAELKKGKQSEVSLAVSEPANEQQRTSRTENSGAERHIRTVGDDNMAEIQKGIDKQAARDAKDEKRRDIQARINDLNQEISSLGSDINALRDEQRAAERSHAQSDKSSGSIWNRLRVKNDLVRSKQMRIEQLTNEMNHL